MTYEQWDAHTTELQDRYGYTAKPPPGRLAKVSVYEFVNDWLPPQLMGKIMGYALSSPHKEGITTSITKRRTMLTRSSHRFWFDCDEHYANGAPHPALINYPRGQRYNNDTTHTEGWHVCRSTHVPYRHLTIYRQIDTPYMPRLDKWVGELDGREVAHYPLPRSEGGSRNRRIGHDPRIVNGKRVYKLVELTMLELKYVNKLVQDLWDLNKRNSNSLANKYTIPNKLLNVWLCENKVPGRTKLSKGDYKTQLPTRRPAITALIKI